MKKNFYLIIPLILLFCAFIEKSENLNYITQKENNPTRQPLIMSFQTHARLGKGTIEQPNQLSVLISTNFNGEFTDKGVRKAKWQNITNRFKLSPITTTDELLSTSADISDLVDKGKPFHIAFRYETPVQTEQKRYIAWKVRDFKITSDTVNLVKRAPLTLYHKGTQEPGRTVAFTSQVIFRGNLKKANLGDATEDWAISAPLTIPEK